MLYEVITPGQLERDRVAPGLEGVAETAADGRPRRQVGAAPGPLRRSGPLQHGLEFRFACANLSP